MVFRLFLTSLALASTAITTPANAQSQCDGSVCQVQMDASQLLDHTQNLVAERRFDEARPYLAALHASGQLPFETDFLSGYVAVETGDVDEAIRQFRRVLLQHPEQTRVRLELARALMLKGQDGGAEHNFRLAAQDPNLPQEILRTIQSSRGILRDRRTWSVSTDFGFAPDSNISNGTSASTIDANVLGQTQQLTLNPSARAQSGVGQTAGMAGSYRLKIGEVKSLLVEADSRIANYKGVASDDATVQLAIGPEFRLSDDTSFSVQALGAQRWFGGNIASRQFGIRTNIQHNLHEGQRVGFSLDARHNLSPQNAAYSGWNIGAYATFEQVIARRFIASASLFGRRDALSSAGYSSVEVGANLGIGGELAHGINAGISGGISRAIFDAPLAFFSNDPRKDLRLNARAYVGMRAFRLLGFSPSITYTFSDNCSTLALYGSKRSRFAFALARYF